MFRSLTALSFAGMLAVLTPAGAQEGQGRAITVHEPWVRASLGNLPTSAAYMRLEVEGGEPDRLTGAATPVAERVQLHGSTMEEGVSRMRPVQAIEVRPGEVTVLAPGGLHLMLVGLAAKLEVGQTVPITLTFEHTGEILLEVPVRGVQATSGHGGHDGSGSN